MPAMTGKLDEISQAIGALQATAGGLKSTFEQHCRDDDRRHNENITEARSQREELRGLSEKLGDLNETLTPIAQWVKDTKPEIEQMRISRWKTAGAIGLAGAILAGVAILIESALGQVVKWLLPHH